MDKKRTRKPNWTEEQCLLLAHLVNEHITVLRGKFGPRVTVQAKKQAWETIAQQVNASFPLVVRTSEDCEKRWYVLQSKAKEEIAAHKRQCSRTGGGPPAKQLSQVAETVFDILGQSEVSITGLREGIDSSMMQVIEMQQSMEPSEEPGPSTSQVYDPQPETSEFSLPAAAAAAQTPFPPAAPAAPTLSLQNRRL
ncbi:uncharacterized protein LOC117269514 [Xyrichtys novacula]|uniref:Uncharacterized protein LOC117269514 n=1 Tax=Xyrichtys novacula TaxID=13765 RepID=A0AAV1HMF1_XYRNO|nr:uncharacterized protein LOC117269514 [Xyrichtys novacula]